MYSKNDLEEDISQIWLIYTTSYEYYYCLKLISKYEKTDFTDSRFLVFIIYSSWYILIIELCKAFQYDNKSQHYNVYGLINKMLNNYKSLDFKSSITLNEIKSFYTDFNAEKITEIRDRLTTLRDKFYAHSDRQKLLQEVNVKLTEIEALLNLLKKFIYEIKQKVFSAEVIFHTDIYVDIGEILKSIEERNQIHHNEIIRKFNEERRKL
ncbi:MAG: hypothetical protein ACFFC3_10940 [Candidatus Odinarchaeota archaeon]